MNDLVSIIIRTYNEEKYLEKLLSKIEEQQSIFDVETIIVDSGSTDSTLSIAKRFNCRITHIKKEDFTFGRSLNIGCDFSHGNYLIFISGHCIPINNEWIDNLVSPIAKNKVSFTYGKQYGKDTTKFSENRIFEKYFPNDSKIPQIGFFCNNANSALKKDVWNEYKFDEDLTGLEDMHLARKLVENGNSIGYVAEAPVYHIHNESWGQIKNRYEREAIALQRIMPELHFGLFDFIKCYFSGSIKDSKAAIKQKVFLQEFFSILRFRFAQYYGTYSGNHNHRKLSNEMKIRYYYPRITNMDVTNDK